MSIRGYIASPEPGDLFSYYGLEDNFHYEDLLQLLQNLHQRDERPQIDKIRASHQHLWRVSSRAVAPPAARIEAASALFASKRAAGGATDLGQCFMNSVKCKL